MENRILKIGEYTNTKDFAIGQQYEEYNWNYEIVVKVVVDRVVNEDGSIIIASQEVQ